MRCVRRSAMLNVAGTGGNVRQAVGMLLFATQPTAGDIRASVLLLLILSCQSNIPATATWQQNGEPPLPSRARMPPDL